MRIHATQGIKTLAAAGIALTAGIASASASAGVLNVCASGCTYSTIQAAIDAARSGDTLSIGLGVFTENIVISNKALTLQGRGIGRTIVTAATTDVLVNMTCAANNVIVHLADITLTGAHPAGPNYGGPGTAGGGVVDSGCVAVMDRTEISGNRAFGSGGGFSGGPLLLRDSVVENNVASDGAGIVTGSNVWIARSLIHRNKAIGNVGETGGGGILAYAGSTVTIDDSDIIANETYVGSRQLGGGIQSHGRLFLTRSRVANNIDVGVYTTGNAMIVDSVITDNTVQGTPPSPTGIVVYAVLGGISAGIMNSGTLFVSGSRVSDNAGGGITNSGNLTLSRSVLFRNDGRFAGGGFGGGLYNLGKASLDTVTVTGNIADSGGGIYNDPAATVTIQNSSITHNTPDNCSGTGLTC